MSNFGCNCPSFRMTDPDPETAFNALVKAAAVTVQPAGDNQFIAWTDLENRYHISYEQGPGGFCKHVLATKYYGDTWFKAMAEGARNVVNRLPTQIAMMEGGKSHWVKPDSKTAKTMCGISLVNGSAWEPADYVSCAKCAKYGLIA